MTELNDKKYYLLSFSIFCLQTTGYNVVALSLLMIAMLFTCSFKGFIEGLSSNFELFIFLFASLAIGFYFTLCNGIASWNIAYWGQFYFLSFALLAIRDKEQATKALKYCVYAIFIADIFTNLLLLIGVDVPWAKLAAVRPGETMSRFGGVKNNALYSGSVTFIAFCYSLTNDIENKWAKWAVVLVTLFNLILSGSYRYIIIWLVVISLYVLKLYKHRILLIGMYVSSIVVVYVSTKLTMLLNLSNFYRALIWEHTMEEIRKSPILGHGFFNMHLEDKQDFSYAQLVASGVTESCILLIGYNFGMIILLFYLFCFSLVLVHYKKYTAYAVELGLFIGLSLDLFWGGSYDNSLSFSLLTLGAYTINGKIQNQIPS